MMMGMAYLFGKGSDRVLLATTEHDIHCVLRNDLSIKICSNEEESEHKEPLSNEEVAASDGSKTTSNPWLSHIIHDSLALLNSRLFQS